MMKNKPFILISNDDGYHSAGIRALVDMVSNIANVIVCAPDSARSGYSCAFTEAFPLRLKRRRNIGEAEVWSCSGTPVDCVKLALATLCKQRRPDMILAGINHGDNSSVNTHYSGTMGVAKEGCMKHIPSVAFSSCYSNADANLEPLKPFVRFIVQRVLANGLPTGVCLNVNFPASENFRGIKICRMAFGNWINEIEKAQHPRGYDYYWIAGEHHNDEPDAPQTDRTALAQGYIAIVPTRIDVTAYEYAAHAKALFNAEGSIPTEP